jgi:hypothetical protein
MTDSEIVKARETCQSILAALGSKQIAAKAAVAEIAAEASAISYDAQVSGGSAREALR